MTIKEISVFSFRLPFVRPLSLKDETLPHREGYLLRLIESNGQTAWGEVSPLPGFSREGLRDACERLSSLKDELTGKPIPDGLEKLHGGFEHWLGEKSWWPSVRFGIEMAVLNLTADRLATPLHTLLSPASASVVRVNSLLSGAPAAVLREAEQARAQHYRAVKLKVGRVPVSEDVRLTRQVSERLGDTVSLRLDANRRWNLDQAIAFAKGVVGCDVEYIEEPCRDMRDSLKFTDRTGMAIALDESLRDLRPGDLAGLSGVKTAVLKPTLLGGIERCAQFAREATQMGMTPVISSSYESSLGILTLAHLASAMDVHEIPVGLDTLRWFKEDIVRPRLMFSNGTLDLSMFADSIPQPDTRMLTEVADV